MTDEEIRLHEKYGVAIRDAVMANIEPGNSSIVPIVTACLCLAAHLMLTRSPTPHSHEFVQELASEVFVAWAERLGPPRHLTEKA